MITKTYLPEPDLAHERSNNMIKFLLRNYVGTNDSIHRMELSDVQKPTAQKLIVRLINRGLLRRWPLHSSKSYLRLGQAAIARWQYPKKFSSRLGPQILPYHLGCLSLTTLKRESPKRLLPSEIEEYFPGFPETNDLQRWAYYRDCSTGIDRLAMIRVEYRIGGDAVINKVAEQFHQYRQHPCINELIDAGRFMLHVVTATPQQEEALWDAAERLCFPAPLETSSDFGLTMFL